MTTGERAAFLVCGCFVGALAGYSHNDSIGYGLAMATLVSVSLTGTWLAAYWVMSRLSVILRKPSSNERNDA